MNMRYNFKLMLGTKRKLIELNQNSVSKSSDNNARKVLLDEARTTFSYYYDMAKRVENKASTLIAMIGIIFTILGTTVLGIIGNKEVFIFDILFLISTVCNVIAIIAFVFVLNLQEYKLLTSPTFSDNNMSSSEVEVEEFLVRGYREIIEKIDNENKKKNYRYRIGVYFTGIATVSSFFLISFIYFMKVVQKLQKDIGGDNKNETNSVGNGKGNYKERVQLGLVIRKDPNENKLLFVPINNVHEKGKTHYKLLKSVDIDGSAGVVCSFHMINKEEMHIDGGPGVVYSFDAINKDKMYIDGGPGIVYSFVPINKVVKNNILWNKKEGKLIADAVEYAMKKSGIKDLVSLTGKKIIKWESNDINNIKFNECLLGVLKEDIEAKNSK